MPGFFLDSWTFRSRFNQEPRNGGKDLKNEQDALSVEKNKPGPLRSPGPPTRNVCTRCRTQVVLANSQSRFEQKGEIEKFCIGLSENFPLLFNRLAGKTRLVSGQPPSMQDITILENHLRIIDSEE